MDNIDDPESFLRGLPPTRYYLAQELHRAGFHWDSEWHKSYEDEDDETREPYPEEGAYYKHVYPPNDGYRISSVTIQSENGNDAEAATWYVSANNIEGHQVAIYAEHLLLADAAKAARELVVNLDSGQIEVVNNKLRPVAESMKLNEGKHKDGCQCGFCKNKGKFGKKADTDTSQKDEKKPTAESIVRRLLDA